MSISPKRFEDTSGELRTKQAGFPFDGQRQPAITSFWQTERSVSGAIKILENKRRIDLPLVSLNEAELKNLPQKK